uniref:Uncharacterized protein n=1 Tax=Chromera velia CCMP2878 TaxID=1169474 RepID=A0A0G4GUU2_9ALVE|mmetsp:Transcript_6433/g.12767  ORF Transcript_6433/g.12767 Transcript_6433/m.12767 type:complete len:382 (-) Transcript_6433:149-1294(-)|eukprot:Cvel_23482.t1-p1 / transcript=Cvel_23482.t1 / gene=Cvel_23482 / organism=Chromera_velia_CCMP2878 / gene_product=hypothetical protein / transcript_product=hypothetical protein / location=Cvel_scaffold2425:5013-6155(-) / protein_length=381 / sequence_SO=supercontig / SO=protein_coding / is_pseudo=false
MAGLLEHVLPSQTSTRAILSYTEATGTQRLVLIPSEAGQANSKYESPKDMREVEVFNGRLLHPIPSVSKEGVELLDTSRENLQRFDFYNDQTVADEYAPLISDFVKSFLKAAEVIVFDHTRRASSTALIELKKSREVASQVHSDYTRWSAHKRLKEFVGEERGEELLRKHSRFCVFNLWRSANGEEVLCWPVAFCDRQTVKPAERITVERRGKDRVGEIQVAIGSPEHRWLYFPRLLPTESLLFCTFEDMFSPETLKGGRDDPTFSDAASAAPVCRTVKGVGGKGSDGPIEAVSETVSPPSESICPSVSFEGASGGNCGGVLHVSFERDTIAEGQLLWQRETERSLMDEKRGKPCQSLLDNVEVRPRESIETRMFVFFDAK